MLCNIQLISQQQIYDLEWYIFCLFFHCQIPCLTCGTVFQPACAVKQQQLLMPLNNGTYNDHCWEFPCPCPPIEGGERSEARYGAAVHELVVIQSCETLIRADGCKHEAKTDCKMPCLAPITLPY